AAGIPTWSPTVVLICRSTAYVWQSGRDAQFSADCGPSDMYANAREFYLHRPKVLNTQRAYNATYVFRLGDD
ncbi:hypothetical protein KCU92_g4270, partial [Aureobasidium melanogenum]